MSIPDLVNGAFELGGGFLLALNCARLYHDKEVKGVSIPVTAFFALWGVWNLYYYPSLDQWASFMGGLVIVVANIVWVAMAAHYAFAERRRWRADVRGQTIAGINRDAMPWWQSYPHLQSQGDKLYRELVDVTLDAYGVKKP